MTRRLSRLLCVLVLSSVDARADWLVLGSRAISRGDSASPDAPVTGYGYGPRAHASLGLDLALLEDARTRRDFRIGLSTLYVFENATKSGVLPRDLTRGAFAVSATFAYSDALPRLLPRGHVLEFGLELGRRTASSLGAFAPGPHRSNDVPFGGGGNYLGIDAGVRSIFSSHATFTSRLTLRSYTNALLDAVGQHEASDVVADSLEEGAELSAALEAGVRWLIGATAQPTLSLRAEWVEPHDGSAKTLWLTRALLGLALPGAQFELEPYVDGEVGHGQGLLVNRTELRLGFGVRLHAR